MTTTMTAKDRILDAAHELVNQQGFSSTTLESILDHAGASKGAFFHHFASKEALGDALVERYAAADIALATEIMTLVESRTADPAEQAVAFVEHFAERADDMALNQPGCLFVSFIYERGPGGTTQSETIVESIEFWREILLDKLEQAAKTRPDLNDIDLVAMADQVFAAFEGGFILARAMDDPSVLGKQIRLVQHYFEVVLGVDAAQIPA